MENEFLGTAILLGFVGVIIIAIGLTMINLPGNVLILIAAVLYGWFEGFQTFNMQFLLILAALLLTGEVIEFIAAAVGAKRAKASSRAVVSAMVGAFVGGIAGTMILPVVGSFAGAVVGVFLAGYLAEYSVAGSVGAARKVAVSAVIGQALGSVLKFSLAVTMATAIIWKLFFQ